MSTALGRVGINQAMPIAPLKTKSMTGLSFMNTLAARVDFNQWLPTIELPKPKSLTEMRFQNAVAAPKKHFVVKTSLIIKIALIFNSAIILFVKISCFVWNYNLCCLGFFTGIMFDATSILDRIRLVYNKTSCPVFLTVYVPPIILTGVQVISVMSFLWYAELGTYAYQKAMLTES
jgi:hypothetical protein